MSYQKSSPQRELESQGWTRRFISDGERLKEAVEMYESIGFEVRLEVVRAGELGEECDICFGAEDKVYYTIYTRPLEKERD
jgi:hypothetical protein